MLNDIYKSKLQLFANENLNTTTDNTSGTNDLSPEMKVYYDQYLIKLAEPNLVFMRYGQKRPIPRGRGKTIEFRKFSSLDKQTTALTEGVTPDGQSLNVTTKTGNISQYGGYVAISDMLDLTAIDNIKNETTQLLASQASRTLDTIVRNIVSAGTNVRYAGGKTSRANLTATDTMTIDLIRNASTDLRRMNAPTFDGYYIAIIHPDIASDVRGTQGFIDVTKYGAPDRVYDGEIGTLEGVRFVESTEAPIWKGGGGDPSGLAVYGSMFLANGAYGVTELEGGGLQMIMKQLGSAGTGDPLDQRATIGWKAALTSVRLVEEYMVRVECCSSRSATAEAN